MHPFLILAKYGRWWAIKTIFLEGVIWVDVQLSQRNFATRNFNKNSKQKRGPWYPAPPPPPPPHPQKKKKKKKKKIWILCQNSLTRELKIRVVGFVLKKLLTYFEMLIVPHALQCVDGCFFVFYLIWHFASGKLHSDLNSLAKFTH